MSNRDKSRRRNSTAPKRAVASKKRDKRRRRLYAQQKGLCAGCKQPKEIVEMTFDHIYPQSKAVNDPHWVGKKRKGKGRGVDGWKNIELLCRPCNAFKANTWPWDWNQYVWDQHTQSLKARIEINALYERNKECRTVKLAEGSSVSS